jgi:hypothetical protein
VWRRLHTIPADTTRNGSRVIDFVLYTQKRLVAWPVLYRACGLFYSISQVRYSHVIYQYNTCVV